MEAIAVHTLTALEALHICFRVAAATNDTRSSAYTPSPRLYSPQCSSSRGRHEGREEGLFVCLLALVYGPNSTAETNKVNSVWLTPSILVCE